MKVGGIYDEPLNMPFRKFEEVCYHNDGSLISKPSRVGYKEVQAQESEGPWYEDSLV